MGIFDFIFGGIEKDLKRELANLDERGIDEEEILTPELLKEKLANYEYYTDGVEE